MEIEYVNNVSSSLSLIWAHMVKNSSSNYNKLQINLYQNLAIEM